MRRVDLGTIRICKRCGRGRAELIAGDGDTLVVRLGPNRARLLADLPEREQPDVPWLGALVVRRAAEEALTVSDVVLDDGPQGLRGLITWAAGDASVTVAACEPEEALETALRLGVPIFATDEALRRESDAAPRGHTVH